MPSTGDTGRAPVADTGRTPVVEDGAGTGRRRRSADGGPEERGAAPRGTTRGHGAFHGYGTPPQGTPAPGYGTPAQGAAPYDTPAHGTPAHGTPAHGTSPHRAPQYGTPAHGTPVHAAPHTPAHGTPVRGGHPAHEEVARPGPERYGPATGAAPLIPGPRRAAAAPPAGPAEAPAPEEDADAGGRGGKGKALTGIAAAAVTTCLAIVVAGQVADREDGAPAARAAQQPADRASGDTSASRSDERPTPSSPAPATRQPAPTYEQLMTHQFPIDPKLTGSGEFEAVPGLDKAPGSGQKYRYRVDVEKGLGLDAKLFARAIQQTLNDKRSWAGQGAMTFERISSGEPDFVITLASPGTTGAWCAKSGLDTTIDNVSCDSASTERVMINAFRWAQGAETFGPKAMYAYRQMLINHEVGHRLGHNHVSCRTPGALAPVMQQQTKSLDIDGIACRPNPWVHPGS
ncbi:hypothetical protein SNE510_47430 [Streptomyces sp. NE5-10]|uniref:DUF3152 domain-containing protein n=1 Tax=Streptomyces sp. NE5-10 TaxID=2759674 RepID=UPI001A482BBF|nr:DUF3152 domain-containing protein [Streptomyces sp. NE5-10]GHJ95224.1 hypothetical protein SNE510_47430 [Streptomyces sp. NE5-10]